MKREEIIKLYESGQAAVVELVHKLIAQIDELKSTVTKLTEQIDELKGQLKKDSHNSSKPPSSDGTGKNWTKSSRKRSGKKPGGQEGHKGANLKMVDNPDKTIVHSIRKCKNCNESLDETEVSEYERRQVFDMPPMKLEVTEHKSEIKLCPHCGEVNKTDFPEDIKRQAQYGKRLKGFLVYLNQYQLLPYERLIELMNDLYSIDISKGTVYNFNKGCYEILRPVEDIIKELLAGSQVLHGDETGMSCCSNLKWLHVLSTSKLTYYLIHAKRGKEAMDEMGILPDFKGGLTHDFWKPYLRYNCYHGFCNAHTLRELTFIHEHYKQKWAVEIIDLLLRIKENVDKRYNRLSSATIKRFETEYDKIISKGFGKNPRAPNMPHKRGRKKQSKARILLERLKQYKGEAPAFMYDFNVPFDNNQAERYLRMAKVKQKIPKWSLIN